MASLRTQRFTQVRRFARVLACCLCVRALVRAVMHEYCHARRLRAVVGGGLHRVRHRSVVAHLCCCLLARLRRQRTTSCWRWRLLLSPWIELRPRRPVLPAHLPEQAGLRPRAARRVSERRRGGARWQAHTCVSWKQLCAYAFDSVLVVPSLPTPT